MRIACVHVPQFALQCITRIDPALRGGAVAVVAAGSAAAQRHAPVVTACSRAAWALGVRIGMPAAAAHAISPEVVVVPADPAIEREAACALADALLALAPIVDAGGRVGPGGAHFALYCAPTKTRGTTFGDRVIARLAELGITARVGIADDRFTAWVAASHPTGERRSEHESVADESVTSVPRGGSAAFLAPRPLSLLAISPEVQHMLEALGVATLGEFAALPAPSHAVVRPFEADYQALARGDSGHALRPYAPEAPISEEVVLGRTTSTPAGIALLAERIALRLNGRARGAARLEVTASTEAGPQLLPLTCSAITAEQLAEHVTTAVSSLASPPWRLRVVVTGEMLLGEPAAPPLPMSAAAAPAMPASARSPSTDTLALVLSTTGALGLRAERRDVQHRRTRRGKQRERRRAEALLQPRLFKS